MDKKNLVKMLRFLGFSAAVASGVEEFSICDLVAGASLPSPAASPTDCQGSHETLTR